MKDFAKQVLPVAFALYGARAVSSKLLTVNIPGFNSIPLQYQSPAMAGIVFVGAHFLTKKVRFLNKWRGGIMIGTGINLVDQVLSAIAPANVKQLFGLAGMGDYVEMGDYLSVGATPIDDDITLRDYVEVGVEEELGLDEELGLEEELGALQTATGTGPLNRAYLGGVSRGSMLKQIPSSPMLAAVPERSFTRRVPQAGAGYDNAESVYGGIFGGGF